MKIQIKIGRRITFPARLKVNYFYFIFAYIFNMQNKKIFVTLFFDFFQNYFFTTICEKTPPIGSRIIRSANESLSAGVLLITIK